MTIEIKETLTGSILDIGGGGEAVIGQIYKDRVTAIDNCEEELEEAPDCCSKQLTGAYASKRQCDICAFFVQKLNIFHYAFINYTISVNVSDQGVFQIRFCRCFSQPLICNLSIWGI